MSLLDQLTADLCAASEHLPLPTLRRAIVDMRRAYESVLLAIRRASALHQTRDYGDDTPLPHATLARLGAATTHLETGAGLLMRAQDEVSAYLTAIGAAAVMTAATPTPTVEDNRRTTGHSTGVTEPTPATTADAETWWATRIGMLTAEPGGGCDDPARSGSDLLARMVEAVRSHDRAALHAQLVGAGAGIGSSLTTAAVTGIRQILTDVLGRPPTPVDLNRFRRAADTCDLLPGLPDGVVMSVLHSACLEPDRTHHDAIDVAVGSAVSMAKLIVAFDSDLPHG